MNSSNDTITFFNRVHLVQGAQILATILCMLGVIFVGADELRMGFVRPLTFTWLAAGSALSALAAVVSRRIRLGAVPLMSGLAIGLLYLAVDGSWPGVVDDAIYKPLVPTRNGDAPVLAAQRRRYALGSPGSHCQGSE